MKPKTLTVYRVEVRDGVPTLVKEKWTRISGSALWGKPGGMYLEPEPEPEWCDPEKVVADWRSGEIEQADLQEKIADQHMACSAEHRRLAKAEVKR